jgi:hypothetical protein
VKFLERAIQSREEEFGLTSNGPLILPCDAIFMEYAITLIQQNAAKDVEKALLMTIFSSRCSSYDLCIFIKMLEINSCQFFIF